MPSAFDPLPSATPPLMSYVLYLPSCLMTSFNRIVLSCRDSCPRGCSSHHTSSCLPALVAAPMWERERERERQGRGLVRNHDLLEVGLGVFLGSCHWGFGRVLPRTVASFSRQLVEWVVGAGDESRD